MLAFKSILDFNPADHDFKVPIINTELTHLFVLATTATRKLDDSERLHHLLTIYGRIKQPEEWAQWVRAQMEAYDTGRIQVAQDFMNSAALQYLKIDASNQGFKGSSNTVQEDIVAMFSAKRKAIGGHSKPPPKPTDESPTTTTTQRKLPPFVRHFKASTSPDAKPFVVGDSKIWDGKTWYFCDCPNHRDRIKWHTHTAESCRTRQRWLQSLSGPKGLIADTKPPSTIGTDDTSTPTSTVTAATPTTNPNDATTLLATALSQFNADNPVHDLIADALNALHDI